MKNKELIEKLQKLDPELDIKKEETSDGKKIPLQFDLVNDPEACFSYQGNIFSIKK